MSSATTLQQHLTEELFWDRMIVLMVKTFYKLYPICSCYSQIEMSIGKSTVCAWITLITSLKNYILATEDVRNPRGAGSLKLVWHVKPVDEQIFISPAVCLLSSPSHNRSLQTFSVCSPLIPNTFQEFLFNVGYMLCLPTIKYFSCCYSCMFSVY